MFFLSIALKNVLRRPGRSLLTIVGIAIGIAAAISLISLAWGFERSWAGAYHARGADLLVGKITTRRPLPTPFAATIGSEIKKLPQVEEAVGVLTDLISIEDTPTVIVLGWEPNTFLWQHLNLIEGRWPANSDERTVALGPIAAEMLHKSIGDTVQIEALEFKVCGRFNSQALSENGAVLMSLRQLQAVTGREGLVNFLTLKLKSGIGPGAADQVAAWVRAHFSGFNAYTSSEVVDRNIAIQAAKALTFAISLVALLVGAVGITNTVLMSVMERLHEIAVLLAVGWQRTRVIKMILIESMMLSLVGGLAGTALGVLVLHFLQMVPWFRGKIETEASAALLGSALLISVILGAFGGLYPAWRGSRIPVVEGLHHE
jgi:putative ABC transport system permease protein